jgi:hypothetical protein
MVDQEGVALGDVAAEFRDHRATAGRKRADVQRQHHMLRDHFAPGVHQCAGSILRFTHDGGEASAEQRVLHLPHDAGEAGLHHLEIDGVDVHQFCLVRDIRAANSVRSLPPRAFASGGEGRGGG